MPADMIPEVCDTAETVLRAKQHLIVDDQIDGTPWLVACFRDAAEIVRRRRRRMRRVRAAGS